ncbi:MAG: pyridoxal-phosphate dependent enzyme, partial [Rickettsiales bacterium]
MSNKPLLTLNEIEDAAVRIRGHVVRTPCIPSYSVEKHSRTPFYLKLETTQPTGAFKLRGATNHILSLSAEECERGVTACSTGNHGKAVAYAAANRGIRAVICMSKLVPDNKVDAVKALGAEVRIIGESQDDAQVEMDRLVAEDNMIPIPPFDCRRVIAGQGTIGLELLEDIAELDAVLIPLSGGGLMAGVA